MDFERKYLWNRWRYRQAVNGVNNYDLSPIEQKKFVNVGPVTTMVSWLMFTHLKSTLHASRHFHFLCLNIILSLQTFAAIIYGSDAH